ncbi:MAG: hypothetical protein GQE15_04325, partial [Archangiaceae bacterium]|nr:hypothetical protein [Archangiaceae bacterium]
MQGTCAGSLAACGTMCLDLQTDPNNCGRCGQTCSGAQVCINGTCAVLPSDCTQPGATCGAGFFCDPIARSCRIGCRLNTDCPTGATCNAAMNQCSCPSAQHTCGQTCVSDTAVTSCGTSCNACPPPPANAVANTCAQGSCSFTCNPGFTQQGNACVDIDECLTNNGGCSANAMCTN